VEGLAQRLRRFDQRSAPKMIRYLTHREINKKKWDDCVHNSFNGLIYASSWYLDIVAENWEALVEDDYERIFPLVSKVKWNIHFLYQPVFTRQLGVISKNILTEEVVGSFLNAIPEKFRFAEINLNTLNKIPSGNYKISHWLNFELDLIKSYKNLHKGYSTHLKRNLKNAETAELTLSKNVKPDEIIELYKSNGGTKIKSLKKEHYQKLKRLAYMGIYKGLVLTYGVYSKHNQMIAGAFFARSKNKMIFLFSGLSKEGKDSNALAFLINSFVQEHSEHHLTLVFEGSNDPNLARFYQGFGSSLCTYPHIRFNRLPAFIRPGISLYVRYKKNF
jgi:hypothetical protein